MPVSSSRRTPSPLRTGVFLCAKWYNVGKSKGYAMYDYIEANCPNLAKRMQEDGKAGKFDYSWTIAGEKSRNYIASLLGRKTNDTDVVHRDWDEIEARLADQKDIVK